jgi:four helix bundle protein
MHKIGGREKRIYLVKSPMNYSIKAILLKNMSFKFESLRVWQQSLDLGERINLIANAFPAIERFNLSNQIRRAADSIGLNIAEGSIGQTDAEQKRFLIFANRSLLEVIACLIKAKKRNYIDEGTFTELYIACESLSRMLQAFINKLN